MYLKNILKKCLLSTPFLRRLSIFYCSNRSLLPEVFIRTPAKDLKSLFFLPASQHATQLNQDIFALLVNRFQKGFFLEIGANDGFTLSNSAYLEECFSWDGLLVEANPQYSESLKRRKSKSVITAVVEKEGYYDFCSAGLYGGVVDLLDETHEEQTRVAETVTVWGAPLESILEQSNAPKRIDFISIDVEGAELSIVGQMCTLKNHRFTCGCIEYNAREEDYVQIKRLLENKGYRIVWDRQTGHDLFFVDAKECLGDV